jgi:hypothetical protein
MGDTENTVIFDGNDIQYIGDLSCAGLRDGVGIEFNRHSISGVSAAKKTPKFGKFYVEYKGEFKDDLWHGKGIFYSGPEDLGRKVKTKCGAITDWL